MNETSSGPRLLTSAPVLLARDVQASAHYWRDALGFKFDRFWGEPPNFVILGRDKLHVMLMQVEDGKRGVPHWRVSAELWNVYFWVAQVDELYADFVNRGARIEHQPCEKFY